MSSRSQGVHGDGGRQYTAAQARKVYTYLQSAVCSLTVEEIADATGIDGRTVRDIVPAYDGVWYLLGGNDGYQLCRFADDGDGLTRRLRRQIRTMTDRLERREQFAKTLPRQQNSFFDDAA